MQTHKYDVISPDGFPIERDTLYPTKLKAVRALEKWVKRYEAQGYYSSTRGRIALEDLQANCKIVELNLTPKTI